MAEVGDGVEQSGLIGLELGDQHGAGITSSREGFF
jgi:hypothetical protein